ncbi:MAG: serine hydrolase domain-containing protein [Bacteriovoracia bacterium]
MKLLIILLFLTGCFRDSSSDGHGFQSLSALYSLPGIAGAVVKDDQLQKIYVEGVRKAGSTSELHAEDPFHLGSCTKAMTATVAAQLIEEGKLNWTSTLSELFPDVLIHENFQDVTFETLLVQRTGLPVEHQVFHEVKGMNSFTGRVHITKNLLGAPPLFSPGSRHQYSNYNYIIARHALERVTGESWEDLIRTRIFLPLEMKSCGFGVTSIQFEPVPSRPWGNARVNGAPVPRHFDNPASFGPASTVHCSLEDWSKFLMLHLDGYNGRSHFLLPENFKKLYSKHPSNDSSYTYGGWHILERNWAQGSTLSHTGSNTLNYAKVWIAPHRNAILMSTANIGGDEAFLATDALIQKFIREFLP